MTLDGEIDLDRRAEVVGLFQEAEATGCDVEVDLRFVSFMDSSGLSAIATLAGKLGADGRTLTLSVARRPVLRLLELSGVDRIVVLR